MRKIFLIAMMVLLPVFAAVADKPSEVAAYIKAERPYGAATLKKFVFHVYDAELWTDAAEWNMKKPFALRLSYAMNFTGRDLAQRSIDEMNGQKKLTAVQKKDYFQQLDLLFPDVSKGDTITAIYLPAKGTRIYHNGSYISSITDVGFSARFIGIWMSPETSEPEVRKQLLTKKENK